MSKPVIVWECGPDIEQRWAQSMCDEAEREHWLEVDLAIERELNPAVEIIEPEHVPIDLAIEIVVVGDPPSHE